MNITLNTSPVSGNALSGVAPFEMDPNSVLILYVFGGVFEIEIKFILRLVTGVSNVKLIVSLGKKTSVPPSPTPR